MEYKFSHFFDSHILIPGFLKSLQIIMLLCIVVHIHGGTRALGMLAGASICGCSVWFGFTFTLYCNFGSRHFSIRLGFMISTLHCEFWFSSALISFPSRLLEQSITSGVRSRHLNKKSWYSNNTHWRVELPYFNYRGKITLSFKLSCKR